MRLKYFVFILIGIFIFSGCNLAKSSKRIQKDTQEKIPVKVLKVSKTTIRNVLEYVGNIKANEEAIIYPKVTGKIVEKVKKEADFVKKDEVIAYIDRDEVGLTFKLAPVLSSLDGVVGKVFVDIGQQVNLQTPIALVVDTEKVKVNLDIPEKYLGKIKLGLKATVKVDAYPEKEFFGKITKIIPVVDLATRTFPLEILIDNPEHLLKVGMFAKVSIILEEDENALAVLKEAILGEEPDLFVYIIKDGRAVLRKVKLGLKEGAYYQVKEGLEENDLVVVMGQQRLYDGALVNIEETE